MTISVIERFFVQLEYEIETLRTVLIVKNNQAAELKRRLGITPMTEMKQDLQQGIQTIKESDACVPCVAECVLCGGVWQRVCCVAVCACLLCGSVCVCTVWQCVLCDSVSVLCGSVCAVWLLLQCVYCVAAVAVCIQCGSVRAVWQCVQCVQCVTVCACIPCVLCGSVRVCTHTVTQRPC